MYDPLNFWEANANFWINAKKSETSEDWEVIKKYIKPEWKVLELGCGTGRWAPYFLNYTGSDISPTLLLEAKKLHPDKEFAHHDMREGVPGGYDLIFTYTSWLHMPPKDIKKIKLPKTNLLFVEPHGASSVEYCFQHDYEKLFKVKPLEKHGGLTVYGRFLVQ